MSTDPNTTPSPGQPPSNPLPGDTQKESAKKTNPDLNKLLTAFNATWLGQGNINAGTNLLVSKAVMEVPG